MRGAFLNCIIDLESIQISYFHYLGILSKFALESIQNLNFEIYKKRTTFNTDNEISDFPP